MHAVTRPHGPELAQRLRDLARLYVAALQESAGPALVSAVLFGSGDRGEAGPVSDIDLLLVVEGLPPSQLVRHDVLQAADARLEPERVRLRREGIVTDVRPILKTPEEAQRITLLYLDMVEDGDLLYDRDGFFATILGRLRERLAALGARRVRRGRAWYWDLKPDFRPGRSLSCDQPRDGRGPIVAWPASANGLLRRRDHCEGAPGPLRGTRRRPGAGGCGVRGALVRPADRTLKTETQRATVARAGRLARFQRTGAQPADGRPEGHEAKEYQVEA